MTDLPTFRHVLVHRANPGVCEVRWSVHPHSWDPADLAFLVFRANGPTGPFELVGEAPAGRFHYVDAGVYSINVARSYYYIIRAASRSGAGFRDSDVANPGPDYDNIATELVRKKTMYLSHKGGMPGVVFMKRSWGPKCARCWNAARGMPEDPNCPSCFGTGITGGYLNPIKVPAMFNPPREVIVRAAIPYEARQVYCEIANFPILEPEDVIVDVRNNIRYTIDNITPNTHRLAIVSQICQLTRVDENDPCYTLPVRDTEGSYAGRSWDQVYNPVPNALP